MNFMNAGSLHGISGTGLLRKATAWLSSLPNQEITPFQQSNHITSMPGMPHDGAWPTCGCVPGWIRARVLERSLLPQLLDPMNHSLHMQHDWTRGETAGDHWPSHCCKVSKSRQPASQCASCLLPVVGDLLHVVGDLLHILLTCKEISWKHAARDALTGAGTLPPEQLEHGGLPVVLLRGPVLPSCVPWT